MVSQLNFEDKQKMLFDCLRSAENTIKGTSLEQKPDSRDEQRERNQSKEVSRRFQGKESIFKRPQAPISKCLRPRHVPDFKVNPHKWKKYSLDDADISDRTNASAAFSFLAEIEKRKEAKRHTDDDMDADAEDKIVFKSRTKASSSRPSFNKSIKLRRELDDSTVDEAEDKPVLKGSKLVMPEYVIGQTSQDKIKRKSSTQTSKDDNKQSRGQNKLHLQHLFDADEDVD